MNPGASTLSYLVPRLYDVTGGAVRLDGVDVRELSFDALAAAVRACWESIHSERAVA